MGWLFGKNPAVRHAEEETRLERGKLAVDIMDLSRRRSEADEIIATVSEMLETVDRYDRDKERR